MICDRLIIAPLVYYMNIPSFSGLTFMSFLSIYNQSYWPNLKFKILKPTFKKKKKKFWRNIQWVTLTFLKVGCLRAVQCDVEKKKRKLQSVSRRTQLMFIVYNNSYVKKNVSLLIKHALHNVHGPKIELEINARMCVPLSSTHTLQSVYSLTLVVNFGIGGKQNKMSVRCQQ